MAEYHKFKTDLREIGNSIYVLVPYNILKYEGLKKGGKVEVMVKKDVDQ